MKKIISILGSTGSIGLTSLSIIDKKKNLFKINILSANKNYRLIVKQIKKYKPKVFIINDFNIFYKIKKKFKKNKILILNNFNQINLNIKNDITITAIPGIAGLTPTFKMIKVSKKILMSNKESIICGWHLIKKKALEHKTKIIPIDSEHYSIMKLIEGTNLDDIKKVYLTASGGPFLNYTSNQLKKITPKAAIKHPKWKMGKKISIDSSTLMNKIFELIEAQKLFNFPLNKLDIIIHPESLVHAIVELKNGLSKFLYHDTSMKIPLVNALFDGKLEIDQFLVRGVKNKIDKSPLIKNLTFKKVDQTKFPIIKAKKRLNEYPSTSIILNAANEVLVDHFLRKKIPYLSIFKILMTIMNDRNYKKFAVKKTNNINQILKIDLWSRKRTIEKLNEKNNDKN